MLLFSMRAFLTLATLGTTANSFCSSKFSHRMTPSAVFSLPPAEESARVLSEYMVRSHKEKLKALKVVEEQKQAEIEKLKKQLDALKSNNTFTVASEPPLLTQTDTVDALQQKLTLYQNFIAKYIVEAQDAKYHAVCEAQAVLAAKYEDKISLLKKDPLATIKNAETAPAAASKSPQGDAELEKNLVELRSKILSGNTEKKSEASFQVNGSMIEVAEKKIAKKPLSKNILSDPKLIKADKPPKKIKSSKATAPAEPAFPQASQEEVFLERNTLIANAGPKSRWGPLEVAKAEKYVASVPEKPVVTITPEIEAADHGLRADGGVGGPSLAERVNLGAELMDK